VVLVVRVFIPTLQVLLFNEQAVVGVEQKPVRVGLVVRVVVRQELQKLLLPMDPP
jgi:hypothetical protein